MPLARWVLTSQETYRTVAVEEVRIMTTVPNRNIISGPYRSATRVRERCGCLPTTLMRLPIARSGLGPGGKRRWTPIHFSGSSAPPLRDALRPTTMVGCLQQEATR